MVSVRCSVFGLRRAQSSRVRCYPGGNLIRGAAQYLVLCTLYLLLPACSGEFDQREEQADRVNPGGASTGTLANPQGSPFVRGAVSIAGAVRHAGVTLRPVRSDGSVDWDDNSILGAGSTFDNGIYQLKLYDQSYRGPILVEVRARSGFNAEGANPATAVSNKFHPMGADHFLYSVVPMFEGLDSFDNHVTPLTTVAVTRGMAFDGSIAGVQGGVSAGMFGLVCRQVEEFFAVPRVRASLPIDFAGSGGATGTSDLQSYVIAAMSQLAHDRGVSNVWDFWLALAQDAADDGILNGSIGFIPNTGAIMPDLSQGNLLGAALRDSYLDPNNLERVIAKNNTDILPGGLLEQQIAALDFARDINAGATREYDLTLRLPGSLTIAAGEQSQTFILNVDQLGDGTNFHPYGGSSGPGFVEYIWNSSAPGLVDVLDYGLISVAPTAPTGNYSLSLTIQPAPGQNFVTGAVLTHSITVRVP